MCVCQRDPPGHQELAEAIDLKGYIMPMNFAVDRNRDLTVFHLSGEVAYSEFIDTLQSYIESKPTIYEVYDV